MRLILFFSISAILFFACKKHVATFDGSFVQFADSAINHTIVYGTGDRDTVNIKLSLIGQIFEIDREVIFQLDTVALVLADEGMCAFPEKAILKAGHNAVVIPVIFDNSMIEPAYKNQYSIAMKPESYIADNYSTVSISFYKQKLIDVFSGTFFCRESEYDNEYMVDIQNTYPVSDTVLIFNFWDFTDDVSIEMVISQDGSKSIFVPEQNFTDRLGDKYIVSGTGNFLNSGEFKIDYTLFQAESGTLYESGTQYYTPAED